jgi:lysyl-tRNA synthetase class 2
MATNIIESESESQNYYNMRIKEIETQNKNGVNMYPHYFKTSMNIGEYVNTYNPKPMEKGETMEDTMESIAGRVMSIRRAGKKLFFIDIQSNGRNVQVLGNMMHYKENDFKKDFELIQRGDIIGVVGHPHRSKAGELSILPVFVQVLTPCLKLIPAVRNDYTDKELRYRNRHLDLICNPKQMDIYKTRSNIISYLRNFLLKHDFIEVETPMMNYIHGGASAKPFVTYHNDLKMNLYMRIAPELYLKKLIVGGYERVFEIGKQFRNESIDLTHNPEFTTCEFYWAYQDYNFLMSFTEELLSSMVYSIFGKYEVKYQMEDEEVEISFKPPFKRLDMIVDLEKALEEPIPRPLDGEEAKIFMINQCTKHGLMCSEPKTNSRLLDKLVGHFLETQAVQPTFIINHPVMMSPLAKPHRDNSELTERFELFVATSELCNAYTELNDPQMQRQRFEEQMQMKKSGDGEAQPYDYDFCVALDVGLPPTAGWGIGLDRLTMFLTGMNNIKEVLLFPAMRQ